MKNLIRFVIWNTLTTKTISLLRRTSLLGGVKSTVEIFYIPYRLWILEKIILNKINNINSWHYYCLILSMIKLFQESEMKKLIYYLFNSINIPNRLIRQKGRPTSSLVTRVFATVFCLCVVVPAEATLISRLGGAAAYDDVLGITWITDANFSGLDTWDNQVAWADSLVYLGFDDWRLASVSVSAGLPTGTTTNVVRCDPAWVTELECRDNELAYMYYYNLGGNLSDDLTGTQVVGDVTLFDIQDRYWSGTDRDTNLAWDYFFNVGLHQGDTKFAWRFNAWAVRSGDVGSSVPVPSAIALMGLGLFGLVVMRRKVRK